MWGTEIGLQCDSPPLSPFTAILINEPCLLKSLGICPRLINVLFATQMILKNKTKSLRPCVETNYAFHLHLQLHVKPELLM